MTIAQRTKYLKFRFLVVIFLILFVTGIRSNAQDLIVSAKGDSINCTIMVQNLKSVNFFYREGTSVISRELPRTEIKSLIVGYYKSGRKNIPQAKAQVAPITSQPVFVEPQPAPIPVGDTLRIVAAENVASGAVLSDTLAGDSLAAERTEYRLLDTIVVVSKARQYSRWFVGLRGGYSNRLFRPGIAASPVLKQYLDELKSGYAAGFGAGYFFWKKIALGVNAELYQSAASMPDDTRDDKVNIGFLGVNATHRKVLRYDKSSVYSSFLLGYQSYVNERREAGELEIFRGKSLGWGVNLGIDYAISPHAALSFTASCLSGTLYHVSRQANGKTDRVKLNPGNFEDLARIALTIGLRFL